MGKIIQLLFFFQGFLQALIAQEATGKEYKNTIRFNVTNPVIFGSRSLIFGYERVLSNRTSFSVNVGQASFPSLKLLNADSLEAKSTLGEKGINLSGDFRFYLSKENKYNAPRGVYIGPYFSYNHFEKRNAWTLKSTNGGTPKSVETTTSLAVTTLGLEMGYQFVIWNRLALDMILAGPGIGAYKLEASLGTNLSEEDKKKFFDNLNQALLDKFPGYSRVIDTEEFQRKGTANSTKLGFRYMIMIGYRF